MINFSERKRLRAIVPILLVILLLMVIVIGEKRQASYSKQLLGKLADIEETKKNQQDEKKTEEKEAAPPSVKKEYKYEGPNALGQYSVNRWKDKKWYAIGDNVKTTNDYVNKVKALNSISTVVIDSDNSKVIGDMAKTISIEKLKDVDLVTVLVGLNDYSAGTPLGTINDDENTTSFYGNLKKLINTTIAAKSNAAIVFITPIKQFSVPNKNGAGLDKYVQAINDVCKSYNILILDLYNKSGIDEKNIKKYTIDNVSMNDQGIQKISQLISDYIRTIK